MASAAAAADLASAASANSERRARAAAALASRAGGSFSSTASGREVRTRKAPGRWEVTEGKLPRLDRAELQKKSVFRFSGP